MMNVNKAIRILKKQGYLLLRPDDDWYGKIELDRDTISIWSGMGEPESYAFQTKYKDDMQLVFLLCLLGFAE